MLSAYGNEGGENTLSRSEKKEKYVMVVFICMNEVNTSDIQPMDTCAQQQLYPSVIWKILWQSKNMTMKTF